jgi:Mrp family chromosome partitioning ATPase/uncharacterized protein involved in exopolysaccharide biosynthesis
MPNRQRRHDDKPDLWRLAHRALRGRYRLALTLAIGGCIAGAGIGLMAGHRLYRATGIVRIAAARGAVMKETDQNRSMPMFDGFIQAQQEVMASRETVEAAMLDENWLPITKRRPISEAEFAESLKLETRRGSDHIHVNYTDADPRVAAAAVRSIIAAYQRSYEREEARTEQQRMDELKSRIASLGADLKKVETEMGPLGAAPEGPASAVDPLYEAAAGRLRKFRVALVDIQCTLAGSPQPSEKTLGQTMSPGETVAATLMAAYVSEQAKNEMELNRLIRSGCGPSHPAVMRLQAAVRDDQEQVAKCEQSVEASRLARTQVISPADLREQEATLLRLSAAAEDEMKQLAAQRSHLMTLSQRAVELRQSLSEVASRMDVLTTEASMGSRLTVVSGGDKPMTAQLDSRLKTTTFGAAIGGSAPIALLILLAGLRRRYRNPIEVAEDLATRVPFVAVLPAVNQSATIAEEAARAVHQLRARLQPPAASPCRAYLVTSPEVGDGKSGIALSLGLSFAAAGYRTLLIDGDLSTRRLTGGLGADDVPGFRNAADGCDPAVRSLHAGLCFMSAGRCRQEDQYTLAAGNVARLLERVRKQFDIILIDSDPLLTGVASAVMANQVDGVLFNVTRDQSQAAVREAMRMLEQQNASIAGCVFNRDGTPEAPPVQAVPAAGPAAPAMATPVMKIPRRRALDLPKDIDAAPELATDATEPEQTPGTSETPAELLTLSDRLRAFGPLVAAVMSSLALSEDENLALIDPPSTAPRITIFPVLPSVEDPYWRPRVA